MRLRDVSERVREQLETSFDTLFLQGGHALVQDIQNVHTVYRPIASNRKRSDSVAWLTFDFEPFSGLIEPFKIYPGRYYAMIRVHRQPSGLPELVTHIARELPSASDALAPDLYASFSHSPKVETVVKKIAGEPDGFRFYHRGNLMLPDRKRLDAALCLPGIGAALPEGYVEDGIPGLVNLDETQMIFLGDLVFYNQGRTADRGRLETFLLNCVSVGLVARYVRGIVRKSMDTAS